jgi:hypothetical protein
VPFLRTRLAKWGLDPLPSKKLVDPVELAGNKLRMSFNSLVAIANFLGFNSKTEVRGDLWLQAALDGSTEALDYNVDHCVRDVLVLEKVGGVLKGSGY